MKFSTVRITPRVIKPYEWEVSFSDLDGERVDEGIGPQSTGFYHYPRSMSQKEAFEALRTHLINKHKDEINRLVESLISLEHVEIPKEKT
jgi:hypothetical protein